MLLLTPEEQIFARKIVDMVEIASRNYTEKFTQFLDERQLAVAQQVLSQQKWDNHLFHGGYEDALRKMLGVFPLYTETQPENFPLTCVGFTFREQDHLTHRDFLGALMALQLKRESIGDILITEGQAAVYTTLPAAQLILQEVTKIGRVGVKVQLGQQSITVKQEFSELRGVISAMRLDCVVALLTKLSREKAQQVIANGLVSVCAKMTDRTTYLVNSGDTIVIRGYGKFFVESVGSPTKMGRLPICCKKYL